ncbi:MAG TPA: 50S ribosomal protein L22 [Bdellovibrionota bacterium]|nr:50S ribosomal protein L22 [Bdellovibrionota bacterium]
MASKVFLKYVRVPPRKARLVADMLRGRSVEEATAILKFTTHKSAPTFAKLVKSALANATSQKKVDPDSLYVKEISVDNGPIMKRFTARAMGRGTRVNKRTSHITVVLDER